MISFHGDEAIKQKYVDRVKKHIELDHLVRGIGWESNGITRGCAVGCTLEKYDHRAYQDELGIPEWLARVEDKLFENLSVTKSKTWPQLFLETIPIGIDLEQIKGKFLIIVLNHALKQFDHDKYPKVKKSIDRVIAIWHNGDSNLEFAPVRITAAAAAAAYAYADAAAAAAAAAAYAAAAAAAADAAYAYAAAADARISSYDYFADELLRLFKECV